MRATTEVVAKAWALRALGWSSGVGRNLPEASDPNGVPDWVNDPGGFVRITAFPGAVDVDAPPRYRPVVSFSCYAATANSSRPPWWKANDIATRLLVATYDESLAREQLTLPAQYDNAHIHTVNPVSGVPRTMPDDPAGYAVAMIDLEIVWSDA